MLLTDLDNAIARTQAHLLSLRNEKGHWEGELSSSALSTATAVVALKLVDAAKHADFIEKGAAWLRQHQNTDGGWGDTTISKSNLSTTLLCWSALHLGERTPSSAIRSASDWITAQTGTLDPKDIAKAVIARYGKDKTFSVPILMLCSLCGTLGEKPWRHVIALPFELAALPRTWFGAIGLPVVSYALPALIAIGHIRFQKAPPAWWNPLRWLRALAWKRVRPMLKTLQPSSGGYLEATPLTSFVTMALAGAGDLDHPCLPLAVEFLRRSMRDDGSWPIDTNLATWGTTLAVRALEGSADTPVRQVVTDWLLAQQYRDIHPFTNAAPGGWAWTDLPGGVPDADDTSSALIALKSLLSDAPQRTQSSAEVSEKQTLRISASSAVETNVIPAVRWLLDLQNRDGGMPTFCRGWGALPFDRSTPEITAHALLACWTWMDKLPDDMQKRIVASTERALDYLAKTQASDGSWLPLWFGNEHTPDEMNPVYGTAQVLNHLLGSAALSTQAGALIQTGLEYLQTAQKPDGSFGGDPASPPSIEETAVALHALSQDRSADALVRLQKAAHCLLLNSHHGTHFPSAPIGLYFARLWYHERLYPVIWTLQALKSARQRLSEAA
ncbi:MAG: squalene--hopene cyclase [Verrucomicrobiaceae bacterium]|nr:squalene--hopene cyclase [Verrucomicrobiaceae bacterium]